MPEPMVSVIIVNWNAQELLFLCISSISANVDIDVEIIVVDNASTDDSVGMIRANFPDVRVLANSENKGFAAANNQAATQAKGRYLLLLNPDTEVTAGSLAELVTYCEGHDRIGVIGPRLINPDGTTQRSCWRGFPGITTALVDALYLWKLPWLPLVNRSEFSPEDLRQTRDVDHLLGACMLIRRDAWDDVGPLDEAYFLFLEETDWCRRAKQNGWRMVYYPHSSIIHHGQHSMRQQPARNLPHLYRSHCRFYRQSPNSTRFGLIILKLLIVIAIFVRYILWVMRSLASQKPPENQAHMMLKGYRQVLRELPSM